MSARRVDPDELTVHIVRWGDPGFQDAKRTELEIFGRQSRFASPADIAAGEMLAYRRWDSNSEFHLARSAGSPGAPGLTVGIVRFLRFDPELGLDSFSTIRDFRHAVRPGRPASSGYLFPGELIRLQRAGPSTIAELATQAVLPAYRGPGMVETLWRNAIEVLSRDGVRTWTMALVPTLFRWYRAMLPGAVEAIGHLMPDYVGSDSVPARLSLDQPVVTATLWAARESLRPNLFGATATARADART